MDSPPLQSSSHPSRLRAHSSLSSFTNHRGAISKRTLASNNDRTRSISVSQPDRLYRLAAEQSDQSDINQPSYLPGASNAGIHWITPQHSPNLQGYTSEPAVQNFPQWTAPTPPRSDSGVPTVSFESNDEPVTTGISVVQDFDLEQPTVSADMSSLGFLLPSQYGASPYDSEPTSYPMDQNYIPPMRMSQPSTTSGTSAYTSAVSSNPALYQSRGQGPDPSASRRQSELPATSQSPYDQSYRRISSPYEGNGNYSMPAGQTIPSISGLTQSPLPSPHLSSTSGASIMPQYHTSATRSPNMYEHSNVYAQQPYTTAPSATQLYASSQSYPSPFVGSSVNEVLAKPTSTDPSVRVLNQRPKPQCWEHGCNGRQFSTFSNLLRHQREKSGTAAKSYCPKCGAEFTRTTARNGHLAHDKCTKQQRASEGKE